MPNSTPCPEAAKRLRFLSGLSVREAAIKAQVGHATIHRLEAGDTTTRMSTLRKLADLYEVPVSALLTSVRDAA